MRGSDGQILQKRGQDKYIGQDLAYLYNEKEEGGHSVNQPLNPNLLKPELQE